MSAEALDMTRYPDVVLDISRLRENCSGNVAIVSELLRHLCKVSGPKWIKALEQGIISEDSEGLREVCHGMKGACVTIFAWRLSNIALELEHLARDGDIAALAGRMQELKAAFTEIEEWAMENIF